MIRPQKASLIEWGFVVFLLLLCAALTMLQFRWTGEIARGEAERLRGNLEGQAAALGRDFDAELTASCDALKPGAAAFENQSRQAAHLTQFKAWQASGARPIFSRIGMAEAEGEKVTLSLIDQAAGTIAAAEWPPGWAALRQELESRANGGPPPSDFSNGFLLEFPVGIGGGPDDPDGSREGPARGRPGGPAGSGGPPGPRRGEHWLILELDPTCLRDHWMPELAAKHLNLSAASINDAEVRTTSQPAETLWLTPGASPRPASGTIAVRFNRLGRTGSWASLQGGQASGSWVMETWPRPGALEALIDGTRRKNLAVAFLLSGLIAASGLALMLHTRKSRQLAEARVAFVETVSHELRTPLTIICGAAHNLEKGRIDPASTREYAAMIGRHGEQLRDMVEQVLDFAKSGREGLTLRPEPLITGDFLQTTLASARLSPFIAACEIHTSIPEDLPLIQGDAHALRRVIFNLLHNAARHGKTPGNEAGAAVISVTAKSETAEARDGPPSVLITICDDGPGIPPGELVRIFEPFFRGATARQNQTRGSGIGLSVAKEIIEAHGGTISADNRTPRGACFRITLPAMPE